MTTTLVESEAPEYAAAFAELPETVQDAATCQLLAAIEMPDDAALIQTLSWLSEALPATSREFLRRTADLLRAIQVARTGAPSTPASPTEEGKAR